MDLRLEGKIALVAASSKGLGRASAEALAQEGAKVTICARDEAVLRTARDEIAAATGAEVMAITADMTKAEDISNVVQAVSAIVGRAYHRRLRATSFAVCIEDVGKRDEVVTGMARDGFDGDVVAPLAQVEAVLV